MCYFFQYDIDCSKTKEKSVIGNLAVREYVAMIYAKAILLILLTLPLLWCINIVIIFIYDMIDWLNITTYFNKQKFLCRRKTEVELFLFTWNFTNVH